MNDMTSFINYKTFIGFRLEYLSLMNMSSSSGLL